MKILILILNVLGFWLMADVAHAEPISLAIAAISEFIGSISIGKLILTVALNVGLSLIEKALAKKEQPQQAGAKLEISMGDDHPMSFIMGSYATAGRRKYAGSWGDDGKTPNAYFTDVIEIGSLPNYAGERGLTSVWIDDQEVGVLWEEPHPDGRGYPVLQYRVGSKDYLWIRFLDGTQSGPDAFLTAKFGTEPDRPWKSTMIGLGCQVVILTARYNTDLFSGIPAGLYQPHPVPLYDIRKDSSAGGNGAHRWDNSATWEPTSNPATMIYNLARGVYYGSEWVYGGQNIAAFSLPTANWMAAANACDATVTLDDGSLEPAFRAGYEIQCDQEPLDVISELLKGCNGRMAEVGGVFKMLISTPGGAVYSFSDDDIVVTEEQDFQPFPSLSETYNAIEATYPEPSEKWATKDAPDRYNADLEVLDGNRRLPAQIQLPAVPFANQVQRVGLAMIQDYRRFRVHQISLPPDAYPLEPNDVVSWTSIRNGYEEKKFLVVKVEPQPNFLTVVTLKEVDPADYDWHSGLQLPTAIGWIGPITAPSQPMVGWTVEPGTVKDAGGIDRRPAIKISCAADMDDVERVWVQFRLKETGDVVFDSDSTRYEPPYTWLISGQWTLPDTDYEARGRYLPKSNRATDWSAWLAVKTPNILIQASDVLDGAIVASKIADAAVIASKIMDEAVTNLKLADEAVSTAKLQVAAVTAEVLADEAVIAAKIADGAINTAKFAAGLKPVEVVTSLPTTGNAEGRQAYLTTDGKLYRYYDGAWIATVDADDIDGTLASAQIESLAASKITGQLTDAQIAAVAAAKVTGTLVSSQIADAAVTAAKIADATIAATKFVSALKAVEIVSTLPTTGNVEGRMVYLTTDDKLYRYTGSAWVTSVASTDITGTLTDAQIAAVAAAKVTGQLTDAQIAAVAAAKVTGTLVASQIADAAITNSKLAVLAVDATKIANAAITTTKISDGAVTTAKITANAITADLIAANAVTAKSLLLQDFENLVPNGRFEDVSSAISEYFSPNAPAATTLSYVAGSTGPNALQITTAGSNGQTNVVSYVPVIAGESFYFETAIKSGNANTSSNGAYYRLAWYDAAKIALSSPVYTDLVGNAPITTSWVTYTGKVVVPAGAAYCQIRLHNTSTTALSVIFDRIVLRRANAASLIVDGGITANALAAGSVTTAKLAAGSVTADIIAANAVTAAAINAGAVTTAKIAAGAVTTATLAALAVTADNLAANAVTAGKIAANAVTAGTIAAAAVTATQIAASAVTADKLASNSVTTNALAVGSGKNLLQNTTFASGLDCWLVGSSGTIPSQTIALRQPPATYSGAATPTYMIFQNSAPTGNGYYTDLRWVRPDADTLSIANLARGVSCTAGEWFEATAYISAHRCTVQLRMEWRDATGTVVGYTGPANNDAQSSSATDPDTWPRLRVVGQAPTGAVCVGIHFRKLETNADQTNSYMFLNKPMLCRVPAGATEATPWSEGGVVLITNGSITANAVTADKIATATITATQIASGAITADTIAANAITTAKIATGAVTTATIAAGAVTAATIASLAVTADKIAANAITAGKIAANAVTAGTIAAGAITATELAANAVTATKLVVQDWYNLVPDNQFQDGSAWTGRNQTAINTATSQAFTSKGSLEFTYASGGTGYLQIGFSKAFAIVSGQQYFVSIQAIRTSGTMFSLLGRVHWLDASGAPLSPDTYITFYSYGTGGGGTSSDIQTQSASFTPPASAYGARVQLYIQRDYTDGNVSIGGVSVIRKANADLIVDGAVSAVKIAANAVTAGKIAANAVTAGTIAAGAVTAATIAAGTITGDKLAANTIGADQIAANAITAKSLILTDFSNIADAGWTNGSLDGWTITGQISWANDANQGNASGWRLESNGVFGAVSQFYPVVASQKYAFEVWVNNKDADYAAALYAVCKGSVSDTQTFVLVASTATKNGWVLLRGQVTIPAGQTRCAMALQIGRPSMGGSGAFWSNPVMRRAVSAELIVDGAVTANKISVNSLDAITATLGAVNISSANIGTLQVGRSNIVAGAISRVDYAGLDSVGVGTSDTAITGLAVPHGTGTSAVLVHSSFSLSGTPASGQTACRVVISIYDSANNAYTAVVPFAFVGYGHFSHEYNFTPPASSSSTTFRFDVRVDSGTGVVASNRTIRVLTLYK